MIDRNFIIGLLASLTLMLAYNFYYEWRFGDYIIRQQTVAPKTKAPAPESPKAKTGAETKPETAGAAATATPVPAPTSEVKDEAPASEIAPVVQTPSVESAPAAGQMAETAEHTLRIKTGVTEVILSNKGAVPVRYLLEKYKGQSGRNIDLRFDFQKYQESLQKDGKALSSIKVYPSLGLKFPKEAFSDKVNQALFNVDAKGGDIILKEGDAPYSVTYEYNDDSGVRVWKRYTFYPNSYAFDLSVLVKADPKWGSFDYSLVWSGLGDEEDSSMGAYSYRGPVLLVGKERIADVPSDSEPRKKYTGEIPWAAHANRYYTAIFTPKASGARTVSTQFINDGNTAIELDIKSTQADNAETFNCFVGPKEHKLLSQYSNGAYSIIDYGWFDIIAKPLYVVLSFFNDWVGNWGWAIIMLTVLMKLIFFPLSQKSFRSMQKLQKLQPHMKRVQEAYKNDKEKLNQEMFRLYKEHKVNPLGGCLPTLIQIPIFFALYKVLLESIELKGAGWILWIKDLAQQDPYYVTPLLMGVTMFIQQMMTPKTGDQMQRNIMMVMPVVFTFLFLTFPSGLVVYWLVNNILTIIQQWLIYREAGKEAN